MKYNLNCALHLFLSITGIFWSTLLLLCQSIPYLYHDSGVISLTILKLVERRNTVGTDYIQPVGYIVLPASFIDCLSCDVYDHSISLQGQIVNCVKPVIHLFAGSFHEIVLRTVLMKFNTVVCKGAGLILSRDIALYTTFHRSCNCLETVELCPSRVQVKK